MPRILIDSGGDFQKVRRLLERHERATVLVAYPRALLAQMAPGAAEELRSAGLLFQELTEQSRAGPADLTPTISEISGDYLVVRLLGPLHPSWAEEFADRNLRIYEYLWENDYLVGGDAEARTALKELPFVEAVLPYDASRKIAAEWLGVASPHDDGIELDGSTEPDESEAAAAMAEPILTEHDLLRRAAIAPLSSVEFAIELFTAYDLPEVLLRLGKLGVEVEEIDDKVVIASADLERVLAIAEIPQVRAVHPHGPPALHNNVAAGIIGLDALRDLAGLEDLTGQGEVVAVADTGLDTGDLQTLSADFRGRIVALHALGRSGDASDIDNHGTHVAGSILGSGAGSNGRVRGVAPSARLVFQSVMDAQRELSGLAGDLGALLTQARDEGARIHNNSWGDRNTHGDYTHRADQIDRFAFEHRDALVIFSAGNDGPFDRVTAPGTAKNALTVGASESVRALPASVELADGRTLHLHHRADDADQVAELSCGGPVAASRRKPDVVAPGTFILSSRSSLSTADFDEDGTRTHAEAVGHGLPGSPFFGTGDQNAPPLPAGSGAGAAERYFYNSGTSMAAALTAGACALVRQFFRERLGHEPSGALLKALVASGAQPLPGAVHRQGWGRIDLRRTLFPAGSESLHFDDSLDSAVSVGEIRTYVFSPLDLGQAVAVTLAWRDPPRSSVQNVLILQVEEPNGRRHRSPLEGFQRNNLQKVLLDPATVGDYRVEIITQNISQGVPELAPETRQDFALVVANATGLNFTS